MKIHTSKWMLFLAIVFGSAAARAQDCNLPAVPDGTTTTTQDRDHMLCELGITIPTLPPRIEDPNAPVNAFPVNPANPEGNWTDPLRHTVVRTAFGQWHTYDDSAGAAGGAMSGYGDYGPLSDPRYTDIDLFKLNNGDTVQSREDWWLKRRPELLQGVEDELYGHIPERSLWPDISWSVSAPTTGVQTVNGVDYPYQEKTITGTIDTSSYPELRNQPLIIATCRTPLDKVGTKVPVIVQFSRSANSFQYTAPYGFGLCGFNQSALQPDRGGANLSSYIIGLINKGNWRKPSDWGALEAWSWGVSRLIDYFGSDPDIEGDKVGVEGHSRYGKATLVTAALDDRVVAAFPSCGGALGTSFARRAWGETLEFVGSSTSEYHWVSGNLMKYMGPLNEGTFWPRKVELLTVDTQAVMALIAPRMVMTNGGTDTPPGRGDAWQDPRGMYLAGALSSPVWEFLGWPGQIIPQDTVFTSGPGESIGGTPLFDVAFLDGTVGYRRHHEGHTDRPDWPYFVQMASRFFNDSRPLIMPSQSFTLGEGPANVVGTATGFDADTHDTLQNWQIKGGSGAYKFAVDSNTGQITVADASQIDFANTPSYTLTLMVGDGTLPSHDEVVTINVPEKINVCHEGKKTLNINHHAAAAHLRHGDSIGTCVQ